MKAAGAGTGVPSVAGDRCLGCHTVTDPVTTSLSGRDKAILDFERSWWSEGGVKEAVIADRFDLSVSRYYEILGEILDEPAAMDHDPLLVRRLRRLRDARQRARTAALADAHGGRA